MKNKIKLLLIAALTTTTVIFAGCSSALPKEASQTSPSTEKTSESSSTEQSSEDAISNVDAAILSAEKLISKEDYEGALKALDNVKEDSAVRDILLRARYGYATKLFDEKKYTDAIEQFSMIQDYQDASDYISKCKLGVKYAKLDNVVDWDDEPGRHLDENGNVRELTDEERWGQAELLMGSCYGTWYSSDTSEDGNSDRELGIELLDGKEYGITSISNTETFSFIWYYLDDPDTNYKWEISYDTWLHDTYGHDMWIADAENGTYQSLSVDTVDEIIATNERLDQPATNNSDQPQQQQNTASQKMTDAEIIGMCAPYVSEVISKNTGSTDAYIEFIRWKSTNEFTDSLYGHTIQANFEAKRVSSNSGAANYETLSVKLFQDFDGRWRLRS